MNIQAIEYDSELTPDVTLHNVINYYGHTMNVLVFTDPSGSAISWSLVTVDSRNYGGEVYPKNFAEIEVAQILSEKLEKMPEANGLAETLWAFFQAIVLEFEGGY